MNIFSRVLHDDNHNSFYFVQNMHGYLSADIICSKERTVSKALGKLWAEILAFDIPSLYLFDMHLMRHFLVFQEFEIYDSLESKIALPNIICLFKESPREYNIKTFQ